MFLNNQWHSIYKLNLANVRKTKKLGPSNMSISVEHQRAPSSPSIAILTSLDNKFFEELRNEAHLRAPHMVEENCEFSAQLRVQTPSSHPFSFRLAFKLSHKLICMQPIYSINKTVYFRLKFLANQATPMNGTTTITLHAVDKDDTSVVLGSSQAITLLPAKHGKQFIVPNGL